MTLKEIWMFIKVRVVVGWFSPVILQISLQRDACGSECVTKCVMQMRVITEKNWILKVNWFATLFRHQTRPLYTPESELIWHQIWNVGTSVDSPWSALHVVFLLQNDRTTRCPANSRQMAGVGAPSDATFTDFVHLRTNASPHRLGLKRCSIE